MVELKKQNEKQNEKRKYRCQQRISLFDDFDQNKRCKVNNQNFSNTICFFVFRSDSDHPIIIIIFTIV